MQFFQSKNGPLAEDKPTLFATFESTITDALAQNDHSIKDNIGSVYDLESFDEAHVAKNPSHLKSLTDVAAAASKIINDSGLEDIVRAAICDVNDPKAVKDSEYMVQAGMEQAVFTLIACIDPKAHHTKFANELSNGMKVTTHQTLGGSYDIDVESFDKVDYGKFITKSVYTAAMATATNRFAETWFKTVPITPGMSGLDLQVTVPEVYSGTTRDAGAGEFKIVKRKLHEAYTDRSLLMHESSVVLPYASAAHADKLVDASIIGTSNISVGSVTVPTRPIKFGIAVDLIKLSGHGGNIGADAVQDQNDTLHPVIGLDSVYISFVRGANTVYKKFSVKDLPNALFQNQHAGDDENGQSLQLTAVLRLTNEDFFINASTPDALGIHTELALSAGAAYSVEIEVKFSGEANPQTGKMEVYANAVRFVAAYNGDVEIADTAKAFTDLTTNVTLASIGYLPDARRSNANMKDDGLRLDLGRTITYRVPCRLGSPITADNPISGQGGGASLDGLTSAARMRTTAYALEALKESEGTIRAAMGGGRASSVAIGSVLVKPLLLTSQIDCIKDVVTQRSGAFLEDLRRHIASEVTLISKRLLVESRYLAALEATTGSTTGYEIIVTTDPVIGTHLMETGDDRSLGALSKFNVSIVHDETFKDEIYISVRRPNIEGADILSYGVCAKMSSLVYQPGTVTKNNAVLNKVQLIPREQHAMLLPILAKVKVLNVDKIFSPQA